MVSSISLRAWFTDGSGQLCDRLGRNLASFLSDFAVLDRAGEPTLATMGAVSRCVGACRLFQCGGKLTGGRPSISRNLGPLGCRYDHCLISSRALGAKGSKKFRDDRVGDLKSPSTLLLAGEIPFSGRGRMDMIRKSSSFGRLSCFLSDSSPPIGNRLSRDLGYLQRGHALFSTSTGEMAERMPVGRAGNKIQNDVAKRDSADKQITDMKILRPLAKCLWLKDNLEFRFRLVRVL